MVWMIFFAKQKYRQRHRGQMYGHQERKWGCEGLGDQK